MDALATSMPGARLELKRVSKTYGAMHALSDVSLTVEPSEFFTLLGPSGSGKSTLLSLLAGFQTPSTGEILVNGDCANDEPAHRRGFGMVFQHYALFPHMTVFENVAYPLKARHVPAQERRQQVTEALALVRLEGFDHRYPRQLSGGQQQRVAMARAIVFRPRVLLMDEPLGALDRKLRTELQIELKQLHRQLGATIIYVSHDQEEPLAMSDRIAVLKDGRLEQVDFPEGLYRRPATSFVAGFIGESNFFPGTLRRRPSGETVVELDQGAIVPVHGSDLASGSPVTISVRPEQMAVVDATSPGWIAGTVSEVIYLGASTKVIADCQGQMTQVMVPAQNHRRFELGDSVALCWTPEAATIHRRS
jgi:spermidine/putrescine ABC transporter ATP-binding subunit